VAHYRKVARAVDIPIMLYNVPGRTACNLLPETATELAAEDNIVAIKEASGNLAQIERAIACAGMQVFSGDDGLNFEIYGLGASGSVSVVSNLLPGRVVRMWQAWHEGDIAAAWKLSRLLEPTARACFVETSPAPVKELLSLAGLCRREPRLPLMPVTEDSVKYLVQFYESTLADLLARDLEVR
jgi:4-hydroxy-tetrahydrodipicolinate synthase